MEKKPLVSKMQLKEFDNKNRYIKASELFSSLEYIRDKLRDDNLEKKISDPTKLNWKKMAGTPTGIHFLNSREAAIITFLALWDLEIRFQLDSKLKVNQIKSIKIPFLFNEWGDCYQFGSAKDLLKQVFYGKGLSGKEILEIAESIAKKTIPESTIIYWFQKEGIKMRKNALYSPMVGLKILNQAKIYGLKASIEN